jgi:hypothetical protein
MDPTEMEQLLRSADFKRLRALELAEVGAFLVAIMAQSESAPEPADFDRFMSMGILFTKAGHEAVDEILLRWLLAKPSAKRLDIVGAVLNGLWNRPYRSSPVAADRVDMLIRGRHGLLVDDDAEYTYLQALCNVAESDAAPPVKEKIVKVLQDASQRTYSPALQGSVRARINRALLHG